MEVISFLYWFYPFNKCYVHQIEMISFIKFYCHSLLPAVAHVARYYVHSVKITKFDILTILIGFFVGLCMGLLLGF
jgi:hypothetical protein